MMKAVWLFVLILLFAVGSFVVQLRVATGGYAAACAPAVITDATSRTFDLRAHLRAVLVDTVLAVTEADLSLRAFFFGPAATFTFRFATCTADQIDPPAQLLSSGVPRGPAGGPACLYSQMSPSKLFAITALARSLNATEVIESGRKGGMSALTYYDLGFRVTSIELQPLEFVSVELRRRAPQMELLDGDGRKLIDAALARSRARGAEVVVILDGPKHAEAYKIFQRIRNDVLFAVFDDTYPDTPFREELDAAEALVFFSDEPRWRSRVQPLDDAALSGVLADYDVDPSREYAASWQSLGIVPGGRWRQLRL